MYQCSHMFLNGCGGLHDAGLLEPFISDIDLESKELELGLPAHENAVCESLSEAIRVAGAAFCTFWVG